MGTLILALGFALCCGCMPQTQPDTPLCRIVTRISITREQAGSTVSRSYTDSDSMSAILLYLRKLNPYGNVEAEPSDAAESCYQIVLEYSDGTKQVYHQIDSSFFQDGSGKWKLIDEQSGNDLPLLFEQLPTEQISETNIAARLGGDVAYYDGLAGKTSPLTPGKNKCIQSGENVLYLPWYVPGGQPRANKSFFASSGKTTKQ